MTQKLKNSTKILTISVFVLILSTSWDELSYSSKNPFARQKKKKKGKGVTLVSNFFVPSSSW